jgi:hypothetical protein
MDATEGFHQKGDYRNSLTHVAAVYSASSRFERLYISGGSEGTREP